MRKQGKFYCAYNDDAYVVHGLMNYKIVNGKVGFPTNSLGKVTSKLDDCKVNYIVIVNDIEEDKKVFSRNNYDKYYDIGIKSFNDNKNMEGIINKLLNLSDEDMNKVVEYIRCL